jgi:hypothetical protein
MTQSELAELVARDLAAVKRVWLDGSLDSDFGSALRSALHHDARQVQEPAAADVAVVAASELARDGSVLLARDVAGPRVVAVLPLGLADGCAHVVRQPSPGPRAHASRAYSPLCVLEPRAEGLVIVELARGVSAADVQEIAEPTLLISASVKEMGAEK